MDDYGDPMRTIEINRAEAEWRVNQRAVNREHDKNERIQKQYQKLANAVGDLLDFIAEGNPVDTNSVPYLAMQKEYFNSVNAGFVEE